MKRIVAISDTHHGHILGVCPPKWQPATRFPAIHKAYEAWLAAKIKELQPIDLLVHDGDAIDGEGPKSGGVELITTNRNEQVDMAAITIARFKAKKVVIVAGTSYHVGQSEDWEKVLADKIGAEFHGEWDCDVNGCILNFKHHVGVSQIFTSMAMSLLKAQLGQVLYSAIGPGGCRPNVIVRGHAHRYIRVDNDAGTVIGLPGMQIRSRQGRRLDGFPSLGFVHIDVDDNGGYVVAHHPWKPKFLEKVACKI